MSYEKMMRRTNSHHHDRDYQPMLFAMDGHHIESASSIAERTAESYNVRVRNDTNEEFVQISKEFNTEDEAIQYCIDNDLDNKYKWVRIYTDKGMHLSGW
jgi:hypothetical protein